MSSKLAIPGAPGSSRWKVGLLQSLLFLSSEKIIDGIAAVVVGIYGLWMAKVLTPAVTFGFWVLLAVLHSKIFGFPENMRNLVVV